MRNGSGQLPAGRLELILNPAILVKFHIKREGTYKHSHRMGQQGLVMAAAAHGAEQAFCLAGGLGKRVGKCCEEDGSLGHIKPTRNLLHSVERHIQFHF